MRQITRTFSLLALFVFVIASLRGVFAQFHPGMQMQGGGWGDLLEGGHVGSFDAAGRYQQGEIPPRFTVFAPHCVNDLNGDPVHGAVTDLKCVVQAFRAEHHQTHRGGRIQAVSSRELVQIKSRLTIETKNSTYRKKNFDGYMRRFLRVYINALRGQNNQDDNLSSWYKLRRNIQKHFGENDPDITRLQVLDLIVGDAIHAVNMGSLQDLLGVIDSIHGEFFLRQELQLQRYPNSM